MATVEQLNVEVQNLKIQSGLHEQRLENVETEMKQLHIENKAIYEINTNVRLLAENMNSVKNDVADFKEDIKDVKKENLKLGERFDSELSVVKADMNEVRNAPNKVKADWWDKVTWLVSGGVISAIVTAIIAHLINK